MVLHEGRFGDNDVTNLYCTVDKAMFAFLFYLAIIPTTFR